MPVIIVLGIVAGVIITCLAMAILFFQVAFERTVRTVPSQTELSPERARELFRRVCQQRVDPADKYSPTIEQLVKYGRIEQLLQTTSRSSAG